MVDLELEALEPIEAPSRDFWEGFAVGVLIVGTAVAIAT